MERMQSPSSHDPLSSAALDALVSNFTGLVRNVGWRHRLSESDIDELIQDVRIRLWRAQGGDARSPGASAALASPSEESETSSQVPASYVYRTATTAALDILRKRRSGRAALHDSLEETGAFAGGGHTTLSLASPATPADHLEASELAEQVEQAIQAIPESRRPVVRMYLAGYPREEIADLFGWTEAKTRNLLYRGLSDLRERLARMGIGGDQGMGE